MTFRTKNYISNICSSLGRDSWFSTPEYDVSSSSPHLGHSVSSLRPISSFHYLRCPFLHAVCSSLSLLSAATSSADNYSLCISVPLQVLFLPLPCPVPDITTYSQLRTNKGPPQSWRFRIGKPEDRLCRHCGGDHTVFTCGKWKHLESRDKLYWGRVQFTLRRGRFVFPLYIIFLPMHRALRARASPWHYAVCEYW